METRGSGKVLKRTGIALVIVGVLLAMVVRFVPASEIDEGLRIPVLVAPTLMILCGAFLLWRGRQYAVREAARTVPVDVRPDVLYLRAFLADSSTLGFTFSSLLTPTLLSGLFTQEEQLAEVLRPFGDLVAIGQPGEGLPKPGAVRIYASQEEWKETVRQQMSKARLVVLRAGNSPGLAWELNEAITSLPPKKLLILLLMMKTKHYEFFRREANRVLKVPLAETLVARSFLRRSGFIRFSLDWKPEFLPLRAPYFRKSGYRPLVRSFRFALKPVFEDFGVEWQRPRVSILTVSVTAVGIAFVLLILVAIAASLFS